MYQKSHNYNLLLSLKILLEEAHITQAAKRLNITQPAMSSTLNRLRDIFHDDLLVRIQGKMQLTDKAEHLLTKLNPLISDVESFFMPTGPFDIAQFDGQITFGLCDLMSQVLLPTLLKHLRAQKCHAKINVRPVNQSNAYLALSEGKVDIAIGYCKDPVDSLVQQSLFMDRLVAVVDKNAHHANKPLTVEAFSQSQRIYYAYKEGLDENDFELFLKEEGIEAPPHLSSNYLTASIISMIGTDSILVTTERQAKTISPYFPITIVDLPFKHLPPVPINQYWHKKDNNVGYHRWLRQEVKTLFQQS